MTNWHDTSPVIPRRAGHSILAVLTGFIGCYNLWIAASGLYRGSIAVFSKHAAAPASRAADPTAFWMNFGGRVVFACLLFGCAVGCFIEARKRDGE
jgi:hypothetical protein